MFFIFFTFLIFSFLFFSFVSFILIIIFMLQPSFIEPDSMDFFFCFFPCLNWSVTRRKRAPFRSVDSDKIVHIAHNRTNNFCFFGFHILFFALFCCASKTKVISSSIDLHLHLKIRNRIDSREINQRFFTLRRTNKNAFFSLSFCQRANEPSDA